MPSFELASNVPAPENQAAFLKLASQTVANMIGKPEKYVVVHANFNQAMCFSGTTEPAALVKICSLGSIDADSNKEYSQEICNMLHSQLKIQQDRIYIQFTDFGRPNWGWNGSTFG